MRSAMADCQGDEARRHADVRGRRQPAGTDDGRGESACGRKPKTERFLPCAFAERQRKEKFAKSLFFSTKMGYNRERLSAFPRFSGLKAKYGGGNHHEQQKFGQDGCGRGHRRGAVLCARPLCGDPQRHSEYEHQPAICGARSAGGDVRPGGGRPDRLYRPHAD